MLYWGHHSLSTTQSQIKISKNTNYDKIKPIDNITTKFSTKIPERKEIKINKEEQNINIFTDGSKDEKGKAGYGIYIIDNKIKTTISEPMNDYNTVFQAEVTAIYKAANILNERNTINKKITIYTDSTSAIKVFNKQIINNYTVKQCTDELNKLSSKNEVSVEWIPGHSNYDGNEIADKLAKEGKNKK